MSESNQASLLDRVVSNSVYTGLGNVSTFIVGLAFAGLTIRFLGEARAGFLMTLQAILGINTLLGAFGLGTPAIRRVAYLASHDDFATSRAVVGSVSIVNMATGFLLALVIVIFFNQFFLWSRLSSEYRVDAFWASLFTAIGFFLNQVSSSWRSVYEALQRYDLLTGLSTLFGILTGLCGFLVLTVWPSMSHIAALYLAMGLMQVILDGYLMRRLLVRFPWPTWRWSEIRPMLGFGGWAYLGTLGSFLFTNLDRLILTTCLGSAALPYYALPQRLFSQIHSVLANQLRFLFPMLSSLGDATTDQIETIQDRLRWFVALVSGAVYSGVALLGPAVLAKLVGVEFARQATPVVYLMCVQGFFHAQMIVPYFTSWALGAGAPNAMALLMNGTLVSLTCLWLIPHYGFIGASLAQLWIGVIALAHTILIQRLISKEAPRWRWARAYISPALMIVIWILLGFIGMKWQSWNINIFLGSVILGGVFGILALYLMEEHWFPGESRWSTLMRAKERSLTWLKRGV